MWFRRASGACDCEAHREVYGVYQRDGRRVTGYICRRCGREWSEASAAIETGDPVSSDEVLDVHAALASPGLLLGDLL